MNLETTLAALEPGVKRPWEDPVRRWRERNPRGPVVGCFPVYSPVELVHAAGALPIGLFGGGSQIELSHADARFVSFVCSIAKSTLELALQGKLAGFDGLLFHSICDVARNLSSVIRRNLPGTWVEYLHLPQNPSSPSAAAYYRAELVRVADKLGALTGMPVTPDRLAGSLRAFNAVRSALRDLYELRSREPDRVSTTELATLARASTAAPAEAAAALLHEAERAFRRRAVVPRDRVRVVVEGAFCEQPPFDLLRVLEEGGCHIVDDDLVKGWRYLFTGFLEKPRG
jgi:benzoyl-CoA reductase subunit C